MNSHSESLDLLWFTVADAVVSALENVCKCISTMFPFVLWRLNTKLNARSETVDVSHASLFPICQRFNVPVTDRNTIKVASLSTSQSTRLMKNSRGIFTRIHRMHGFSIRPRMRWMDGALDEVHLHLLRFHYYSVLFFRNWMICGNEGVTCSGLFVSLCVNVYRYNVPQFSAQREGATSAYTARCNHSNSLTISSILSILSKQMLIHK